MHVKDAQTFGWEKAIKGMRYAMNSEHLSDSMYKTIKAVPTHPNDFYFEIGDKDLDLVRRLIIGGEPHRKFMRCIHAQIDINMALTWWKHFDTYKVGTTALSRSTMHKIMSKPLTLDDFAPHQGWRTLENIIVDLNNAIEISKAEENPTEKEHGFHYVIDMLPNCYQQERMVDLNYEVLLNILRWRHAHKLPDWHFFCKEIVMQLPYMEEFYNWSVKK